MNHAATRDTLLPRLLRSYAAYYDVEPMEAQEPLVATAFFHVHGTKYVLSKKAELWATDNNEYVYFFSVPHLTEEDYTARLLCLLHNAGLDITIGEFKTLLVLRRQLDQQLLCEKDSAVQQNKLPVKRPFIKGES